MKKLITFFLLLLHCAAFSQPGDQTFASNIRSVKLFKYGDMLGYPIINLNSNEQLELHFDDMDADIKNYYYSYQLCNADWSPTTMFTFDYIRGFQSNRINTYRQSSIAYTRYTHYQAFLPDRNCVPSRSGNYILRVFLNDDTSKLVFTKRFLVLDNKVAVAAHIAQTFGGQYFRTHQRVQVAVNTAAAKLNAFSQADIKVNVVQNYTWSTAVYTDKPTIFRGNFFEYSGDELSFPAGKEWRWINLHSLRLMSDRMMDIVKGESHTEIYVKPDIERRQQVYVFYRDLNGMYSLENTDGNNPYWQSDYAFTHFTFVPPGNRPYAGKSIHIYGELTNYITDENSKMIFNEEKGVYEKTMFLKQGYYNYSYVTVNDNKREGDTVSFESTEGNNNTTENSYMILVYFRSFGGRADELIGYARLNSLSGM